MTLAVLEHGSGTWTAGQSWVETRAHNARRRSKSRTNGPVLPKSGLSATSHTPSEANTTLASGVRLPPAADETSGQFTAAPRRRPAAHAELPALIGTIRELHYHRRSTMQMQFRIDNNCRSLVRRRMGWHFDSPEKEREKINAAATAMVESIQSGETISDPLADALRPFCIMSMEARKPYDVMRAALEKQLRTSARQLPVWEWAESVKGFGELGLATIVGEAGDLSNYGNPAKVWKRFGLHVGNDGKAARNTTGEVGHSAARRSASWVITDSLLRQVNPYSRLYRERREYERERNPDFDKGIDPKTNKQRVSLHCDRRARRYAEKRFLRDLWRAWRDAK